MSDKPRKEELRPHLRQEPPPADGVIILRGGPTTVPKLAEQARRIHDAFALDSKPVWGVSVFAALDDIGPGSLDGLLRRFASYRVVHLRPAREIREAGFELLPSFSRPHFTVLLTSTEDRDLAQLVLAFGQGQPNPYHWRRPRRR
jgi:hypothetical protein